MIDSCRYESETRRGGAFSVRRAAPGARRERGRGRHLAGSPRTLGAGGAGGAGDGGGRPGAQAHAARARAAGGVAGAERDGDALCCGCRGASGGSDKLLRLSAQGAEGDKDRQLQRAQPRSGRRHAPGPGGGGARQLAGGDRRPAPSGPERLRHQPGRHRGRTAQHGVFGSAHWAGGEGGAGDGRAAGAPQAAPGAAGRPSPGADAGCHLARPDDGGGRTLLPKRRDPARRRDQRGGRDPGGVSEARPRAADRAKAGGVDLPRRQPQPPGRTRRPPRSGANPRWQARADPSRDRRLAPARRSPAG